MSVISASLNWTQTLQKPLKSDRIGSTFGLMMKIHECRRALAVDGRLSFQQTACYGVQSPQEGTPDPEDAATKLRWISQVRLRSNLYVPNSYL